MTNTTRIHRIRYGVRAALTLGVAASIAANVLHAQPNTVGRLIAAWPPVALLITVELISRVPVHGRVLPWLRMAATASIASIAAWVSYWHMAAVAQRYGESPDSAHLIPLSVDGLVVVASICLVELGARLRAVPVQEQSAPTGTPAEEPTGTPTGGPAAEVPVTLTSTPDPDPAEAPSVALVLATAGDAALLRKLRRDIAAGRLKPNPGVAAIRTHLTVGTDKARRLRDALEADTASDEREAAHA